MMNFKTLAASALIAASAFSAPSAQAFGFGDALSIVNTVVNTVEAVEAANRPAPAPVVQAPAPVAAPAEVAQAEDRPMTAAESVK